MLFPLLTSVYKSCGLVHLSYGSLVPYIELEGNTGLSLILKLKETPVRAFYTIHASGMQATQVGHLVNCGCRLHSNKTRQDYPIETRLLWVPDLYSPSVISHNLTWPLWLLVQLFIGKF